jgi:hypothetical protein
MFYLFILVCVYIYMPHCIVILATQHQTSTNNIQQPIEATLLQLQGGGTLLYTKWSTGTEISTREELGVSVFRSGAVNEHVLFNHPFTTRSQWRG